MSIGLRAFGIGTVLAVVGALLLGRRQQRTPARWRRCGRFRASKNASDDAPLEADGLAGRSPWTLLLEDLNLRELFSTLVVTPASRVDGQSECGEIALQAVRCVASLNSETRAAVP